MGKMRCLTYISRRLHDKLFQLKERYEEVTGIELSDSAWLELCLSKGYPTVLGFLQSLEEEQ